jgi:hypothetical protein
VSNPNTTAEPTDTPEIPSSDEPGFGWTAYAEKMNGRFAMIGILALILLEWFTHKGFLEWLGVQ